jgi:cell shape-determining protein MreC
MRFRKLDRYLLVLALLFVLAALRRTGLPGEEMLPDLYRVAVHGPLLAPLAQAASAGELDTVALKSELEVARREITLLKEQLTRRDELARYFGELQWEGRPRAVPGWVCAVDADTFQRNLRISVGVREGVAAGQPVVEGKALLGLVFAVEPHLAFVRRVDDPGFRLEVEVETAKGVDRGVARGLGDRGLEVAFLRRADAIAAGNPVFTSRYHPDVPPGLLVGWVESVKDLDRDDILEVSVTPAAALGRWAQVHVLRRQ